MPTKVLTVTHDGDPHAEAVERELDELKTPHFRLNTDRLHTDYALTYRRGRVRITGASGAVDLGASWTVWNRRFLAPELPDLDEELHGIVEEETEKALEGIVDSHPGRVVDRWFDNRRARNKITQYRALAQTRPDLLPDTLITNDPARLEAFYEEHERICHKQQSMRVIERDGGVVAYTNVVEQEHLDNAARIRNNPCYFQEYIPKDYELRIAVVGERVLPVAIHSQDSDISRVDYRRYDFENVEYEAVDVPEDIAHACRSLTRRFNLTFSAIDMIKTPDDGYVFLEMNPNGQWLWTEQLSGAPIARALAQELSRG